MTPTRDEVDPDALRRLDLEGPVNFRDLGGYTAADGRRVRRRHLFRSDALHRLTVADVEKVHALGVTTVIDFRTTHEVEAAGRGGIALLDAEHLHVPTFDTTRSMVEDEAILRVLATAPDAYMAMLTNGGSAYATASDASRGRTGRSSSSARPARIEPVCSPRWCWGSSVWGTTTSSATTPSRPR